MVDPEIRGLAFGILFCCQNLSLVLFSLVIGILHDRTEDKDSGYFYVMIFFIGCWFTSYLCSLGLLMKDNHSGKELMMSKKEKQRAKMSLEGEALDKEEPLLPEY